MTKKNKYNAKKTILDGWSFDSKAEAKRYQELKMMQKNEEIKYFLCQVPFRLPGNIIYRVDFAIFSSEFDWTLPDSAPFLVEFQDVKGVLTPLSKMKIKQVQEIYGITINLITKNGIETI